MPLQTLTEQQSATPKAEQVTHLPLESVSVGRTSSLHTSKAGKFKAQTPVI